YSISIKTSSRKAEVWAAGGAWVRKVSMSGLLPSRRAASKRSQSKSTSRASAMDIASFCFSGFSVMGGPPAPDLPNQIQFSFNRADTTHQPRRNFLIGISFHFGDCDRLQHIVI